MPRLGIVRHQIGLKSEPFILQQARQFSDFEPLLICRDSPTGESHSGIPSVSIAERYGSRASVAYTLGLTATPLLDILREEKVDILLCHFGVEGSYAISSSSRLAIPQVTVFHGFDATVGRKALLTSGHPSWINYALRRRGLARNGTLHLPVSCYIRERLLQLGFPSDRTRVHHTGIELRQLAGLPPQKPPSIPEVVHVARLVEKKGTEVLIRAVALAKTLGHTLRLTCVGDGPQRPKLESLVQRLGCAMDVDFLGALPHEETLRVINRATLLCLPSVAARSGDAEGLGHVLLEAAALGKPVVATDHGGIPDAVVDGLTGILVPEANIASLQRALCAVTSNRSLAVRLGRQGRARVYEMFDIRRQTSALEEIMMGLWRA